MSAVISNVKKHQDLVSQVGGDLDDLMKDVRPFMQRKRRIQSPDNNEWYSSGRDKRSVAVDTDGVSSIKENRQHISRVYSLYS